MWLILRGRYARVSYYYCNQEQILCSFASLVTSPVFKKVAPNQTPSRKITFFFIFLIGASGQTRWTCVVTICLVYCLAYIWYLVPIVKYSFVPPSSYKADSLFCRTNLCLMVRQLSSSAQHNYVRCCGLEWCRERSVKYCMP